MTTPASNSERPGERSSALARLVSGPTVTTVISPGFERTVSIRKATASEFSGGGSTMSVICSISYLRFRNSTWIVR